MKLLNTDNALFVDCDETLILWGDAEHEHDEEVKIQDPYIESCIVKVVIHKRNIDLVKRNKGQGKTIIVWSAGGSKHAETVVKAVKLEKYVDYVMSKPNQYVDDLDMKDWHCSRIYLNKNLPKHTKDDGEDTLLRLSDVKNGVVRHD